MTLREYLFRHRISQVDFAAMVGVHSETVHLWVSHKKVPQPRNMRQIIAATDGAVQPGDFYETVS